jgi:hypothetical protein
MKYFDNTVSMPNGDNVEDMVITKIASEVINISFSKKYLNEDGTFVTNPERSGYNIWEINGVEYDTHPITGYIILIVQPGKLKLLEDKIMTKVKIFQSLICMRDIMASPNVGKPGTTQYICLENMQRTALGNIDFVLNFQQKSGSMFNWCITSPEVFNTYPIIGNGEKYPADVLIHSISSIIYDPDKKYGLPDGYKLVDFPSVKDTTLYKENRLITEHIDVSLCHGITLEIAKLCGAIPRYKSHPDKTKISIIHSVVNRKIHWLKWEEVKPIILNENFTPIEYIKKGALDNEDYETENTDNKCFITGIPIYEDCYVFDVYEQEYIYSVTEEELKDYPDATIIEKVEDKERYDTSDDDMSDEEERKKSKAKKSKVKEHADKYMNNTLSEWKKSPAKKRTIDNFMDRIKGLFTIIDVEHILSDKCRKYLTDMYLNEARKILESKKRTKKVKSNIADGSPGVTRNDVDDSKNERSTHTSTMVTKKITTVKMPPKRKSDKKSDASGVKSVTSESLTESKKKEPVLVKRVVKYDKPKHLLISPYYVHCSGLVDPIKSFEESSGTKVILWRTFCPTTLHSVIEELNIRDVHKQFLLEFNKKAKYNKNNDLTTENVTLYNSCSGTTLFNSHKTNMIGSLH